MKRMPVILALLVVFSANNVGAQGLIRQLPERNLASPVLIEIGSGNGSGFYLNAPKYTYLVTAKHVLVDEKSHKIRARTARATSYSRDFRSDVKNILELDLEHLLASGNLKIHPEHDVAVIVISTLKPNTVDAHGRATLFETVEGVTTIEKAPHGIMGISHNSIVPFDSVYVSNDIFIFGYPTSLGLKDTPQIDYSRPLLRKGIVAGTNEKAKTIIIDCPAYGGNSGGPVIQLARMSGGMHLGLIGVLSAFVPFADERLESRYGQSYLRISNSGYSIVEPMDHVLELLK